MNNRIRWIAVLLWALFVAPLAIAQTREVPKFEVDPNWPQLPSKWVWGQVSSVSIDERQHAWVLQRPGTIRTDQKGKAAPPLIVNEAQIDAFVAALTAVVDATRGIMLQGTGWQGLAPEFGIIAAWLVLSFLVALRIFRWR